MLLAVPGKSACQTISQDATVFQPSKLFTLMFDTLSMLLFVRVLLCNDFSMVFLLIDRFTDGRKVIPPPRGGMTHPIRTSSEIISNT